MKRNFFLFALCAIFGLATNLKAAGDTGGWVKETALCPIDGTPSAVLDEDGEYYEAEPLDGCHILCISNSVTKSNDNYLSTNHVSVYVKSRSVTDVLSIFVSPKTRVNGDGEMEYMCELESGAAIGGEQHGPIYDEQGNTIWVYREELGYISKLRLERITSELYKKETSRLASIGCFVKPIFDNEKVCAQAPLYSTEEQACTSSVIELPLSKEDCDRPNAYDYFKRASGRNVAEIPLFYYENISGGPVNPFQSPVWNRHWVNFSRLPDLSVFLAYKPRSGADQLK